MKVFSAVVLIVVVFVASIAGSYVLGLRALHQSQGQWCTTLALLTRQSVPRPADPKADPSRERGYLFYAHLKDLEREFGCQG
jgi:hypothetical protein